MRLSRRFLRTAVVFAALLVSCAVYFLYLLSAVVEVPRSLIWDRSSNADAAIVLSGDPNNLRTLHGVELHRTAKVRFVLITGHGAGGDSARYLGRVAVDAGLPEDRLIIEPEARSTWENLNNTRAVLEARGMDSVIVVTSRVHARRAAAVAQTVFSGLSWSVDPVDAGDEDLFNKTIEILKAVRYAALGYLPWKVALGGSLVD